MFWKASLNDLAASSSTLFLSKIEFEFDELELDDDDEEEDDEDEGKERGGTEADVKRRGDVEGDGGE